MLFALQQIWTPGTQRTGTWCYTLSAEQATWKTCHTTTYSQQLTVGRRLLKHVIYRGKVGCEFLIRIARHIGILSQVCSENGFDKITKEKLRATQQQFDGLLPLMLLERTQTFAWDIACWLQLQVSV